MFVCSASDRMRWSLSLSRTIIWFVRYSFPFHSIFDKINVFDHWLSLFFCVSVCVCTHSKSLSVAPILHSRMTTIILNICMDPHCALCRRRPEFWRRKKNVSMRAIESVFGAPRWIKLYLDAVDFYWTINIIGDIKIKWNGWWDTHTLTHSPSRANGIGVCPVRHKS